MPVVVVSSSTATNSEAMHEALARGATACVDKSRLIADGPKLVRALQVATAQHLRVRLRRIEHMLEAS